MKRSRVLGFSLAFILMGCAELQPRSVSSQPQSTGAAPDRTNLLHPLRHDANYGLIRYGSGEVLFRDLTKPHPSMVEKGIADADGLELRATALTQPSTEDHEAFSVGITSWDEDTIGRMVEESEQSTLVPENSVQSDLSGVSVIGVDERNTPFENLQTTANSSSVDGCQGAGGYVRMTDEIWLARQKPERWTIQVVSAVDATEPCIDDEYLTEIDATNARRYSVYYDNALWNIAVVGSYDTSADALAAANHFDVPWVREIGEFRTRRCNSVAYMPNELKTMLGRWCRPDSTVAEAKRQATELSEPGAGQFVAAKPVTSGSPFHQ